MNILINLLISLLPVMAIEKVPMVELDFEAYKASYKILAPPVKVTEASRYVYTHTFISKVISDNFKMSTP